jgi:two-component system chemotaxis response regulator CheB
VPNRDIIAIGTSAGGVEALKALVAGLPSTLPASIVVVMHLPQGGRSFLAEVLSDSGPLPASEPTDGDPMAPGRIYVAPPDSHLLVGNNTLHLTRGPKEGLQRPSINVTFRSAAMSCRERVIGMILTGMLDDGTAGLWEIKRRGGLAIVQDPDEAVFPSMPTSAISEVEVDFRVGVRDVGALLARLTSEQIPSNIPTDGVYGATQFSGLTCPECRGPMWERALGTQAEYRCRVGHAFSTRALLSEQSAVQERKLYEAIITLEESADLSEYLATRTAVAGRTRLMEEAEQLRQHASSLRGIIETRPSLSLD